MSKRIRITTILLAAMVSLPASAQVKTSAVADFNTCAKPVWPREALRHEQQGTVTLSFLIGTDGAVKESRLLKSSGFPLLDLAAQLGIEQCKFRPGISNGQPVESWMKMQYQWTLAGKAEDPAARLPALRDAAERGDAESQYKLGTHYWVPNSPQRDVAESERWLQKAADQGHLDAQYALGMTRAGLYDVARNIAEAGALFQLAANRGHAGAQFMLGMMHLRGQGMAKDEVEGIAWLRKAAAQDLSRARTELAIHLMRASAPDSRAEGMALLNQAAEQGDARAVDWLGNIYANGLGVERDPVKGAEYYKRAAGLGHVQAQLSLAGMYERGDGVPVDLARATQLREAAAQSMPR